MDRSLLERVEAVFAKLASEPVPAQSGDTLTMSELDSLMAKQKEWVQGQDDDADARDARLDRD